MPTESANELLNQHTSPETKARFRRRVALAPLLGLLLASGAAGATATQAVPLPPRVVVGSKSFPEAHLLGEMFSLLLEEAGFAVDHRSGLGGTLVCFTALTGGEIDLYPEYTGTGWAVILEEEAKLSDSLRVFLQVAARCRERYDVEWLDPLGPNNTYALAVRGPLARELGLKSISDLVPHAKRLRGGFSLEFLNRGDGYPGLAGFYGFELAEARGMEHGLVYEALASETIDLLDAYSTDGELLRYDLEVLEDDRRFFPPYDVAPVVRGQRLRESPEIRTALQPLAFRITDRRMMELNHAVQLRGGDFRAIAREYLVEEGLLGARSEGDVGAAGSLWEGLLPIGARALVARLREHVFLTLVSVLLACALAIPLGIAIARRPWAERLSLGLAGIAQTIPSLALLACLIAVPGFGLRTRTAVAALTLYALLPVLRNTLTGLRTVEPSLVDAARGMGLTERQILLHVQLPLALRTIMAGIRTATVITVGFATLAAFIGAGGLGEPILTGLYLSDVSLILSGAIPAALLALLVDFALGRIERRLSPPGTGG